MHQELSSSCDFGFFRGIVVNMRSQFLLRTMRVIIKSTNIIPCPSTAPRFLNSASLASSMENPSPMKTRHHDRRQPDLYSDSSGEESDDEQKDPTYKARSTASQSGGADAEPSTIQWCGRTIQVVLMMILSAVFALKIPWDAAIRTATSLASKGIPDRLRTLVDKISFKPSRDAFTNEPFLGPGRAQYMHIIPRLWRLVLYALPTLRFFAVLGLVFDVDSPLNIVKGA